MPPGRKPRPTKLTVLEGNPGKRKVKEDPDMSSSLPLPPSHLDKYAKKEWKRLAAGLHTLGILYEVDTAVFAAYCQAYSTWRTAREGVARLARKADHPSDALVCTSTKGTLMKHPLVDIAEKAAASMVKYAAEFGLSPSARARLAIDPAKPKEGKGFGADGMIGGSGRRG